jgi:hypothetical protein
MTQVSQFRTLCIYPWMDCCGLRWPTAQTLNQLDYSLDLTAVLEDDGDTITGANICMAPSTPTLDAQPLFMQVTGGVVTVWIAGGVPGRDSLVQVEVETSGNRVHEFLVSLLISRTAAAYPLVAPLNLGYGTPVYWPPRDGGLIFSAPDDSGYLALL